MASVPVWCWAHRSHPLPRPPHARTHTPRGVLTRCWLSFEVSRFRPATQLCGLIDSKIGSVCVAGVGGGGVGWEVLLKGEPSIQGVAPNGWAVGHSCPACIQAARVPTHTHACVRRASSARLVFGTVPWRRWRTRETGLSLPSQESVCFCSKV